MWINYSSGTDRDTKKARPFVTWVEFLECYDRQQTKWPWLLTNISVNTIEARNFWITCCCFFLLFSSRNLKFESIWCQKKYVYIHFNIFKKVVLRCFVKIFAKTCIIKKTPPAQVFLRMKFWRTSGNGFFWDLQIFLIISYHRLKNY